MSSVDQTDESLPRTTMLGWSALFFLVAMVGAMLVFAGLGGAATQAAWGLFLLGVVLGIVLLFLGGEPPN